MKARGAGSSVGALRVGIHRARIQKFALEYKEGDQWKPIFDDVTMPDGIYIKNFPPFRRSSFGLISSRRTGQSAWLVLSYLLRNKRLIPVRRCCLHLVAG